MKILFLLIGGGVSMALAIILMLIGIVMLLTGKKGAQAVAAGGAPMPLPLPVSNTDYAQPVSYTANPDYGAPQAGYSPPAYSPPTTPVPRGTAAQPMPVMLNDPQPTASMAVTEFAPIPDLEKTVMVNLNEPLPSYGQLICTAGPLLGQRFELGAAGVLIGRERSVAQIVVEDPRVSKKHLWVGDRGGDVVAVDQGSTNGTFLNAPNSPRITETVLHPGDVVIISDDVVRFEYER